MAGLLHRVVASICMLSKERLGLPRSLSRWRDAKDTAGPVDVATIETPPGCLPPDAVLRAFDETHLDAGLEDIAIGDPLTIVGFPLGFHDTLHHLALARSASIASAYGVRFQQQGCSSPTRAPTEEAAARQSCGVGCGPAAPRRHCRGSSWGFTPQEWTCAPVIGSRTSRLG